MLVEYGALTEDERSKLLESSTGHNAVLGWMWAAVANGVRDGRLVGMSAGGPRGWTPWAGAEQTMAIEKTLEDTMIELRATYASITDELSGRMPLAYTQLVQILVDLLVLCTPFALLPSVGAITAVSGTCIITFFYSSVLNLAKVFLDPYDNESYGGELFGTSQYHSGISINVATLLQETNLGSRRWQRSATSLPAAARLISPPGVHGTEEDISTSPSSFHGIEDDISRGEDHGVGGEGGDEGGGEDRRPHYGGRRLYRRQQEQRSRRTERHVLGLGAGRRTQDAAGCVKSHLVTPAAATRAGGSLSLSIRIPCLSYILVLFPSATASLIHLIVAGALASSASEDVPSVYTRHNTVV